MLSTQNEIIRHIAAQGIADVSSIKHGIATSGSDVLRVVCGLRDRRLIVKAQVGGWSLTHLGRELADTLTNQACVQSTSIRPRGISMVYSSDCEGAASDHRIIQLDRRLNGRTFQLSVTELKSHLKKKPKLLPDNISSAISSIMPEIVDINGDIIALRVNGRRCGSYVKFDTSVLIDYGLMKKKKV